MLFQKQKATIGIYCPNFVYNLKQWDSIYSGRTLCWFPENSCSESGILGLMKHKTCFIKDFIFTLPCIYSKWLKTAVAEADLSTRKYLHYWMLFTKHEVYKDSSTGFNLSVLFSVYGRYKRNTATRFKLAVWFRQPVKICRCKGTPILCSMHCSYSTELE